MLKRLMGCVRQYRRQTFLTPVLVTMEVVMEVVIPLLMASLIDYGIDRGDMNYIVKMGLALMLAALLSLLFGVLAGRTAAVASTGFARNLRHDMFYNVQNFSFQSIDKFDTGSIVTRLTTDVTNVQQSFQMITRMAVRAPIMLIFSLLVSFRVNVPLTCVFLAALPVLGLGLYFIIRTVFPLFNRVFRTYDKLNSVVSENLRGIRVVKSAVRQEHEKEKFDRVSQSIFEDFSRAEKTLSFNMPLMQFCMYACMLLISWFGARMIVAGGGDPATGLSTGQLMSLITYAMQILSSLMMVSMVLVMITMSRASGQRIVEILDEPATLHNPDKPVYDVPDGSIDFDHVSFSYGRGKNCLNDINLHIRSGMTVGILGGTGSSKSTLVQMIPRLYDVTGGSVRVGGVDVRDYDIETLRQQVAMVLQKNVLFSGTIRENLRWGKADATDEELVHACRLSQADEFIKSFPDGYDTVLDQGGVNLSGGQKQRLCIARALLKNPKILILDDSTSAVDTTTDARIREAFQREIPGTTKLIIAQRVSSVQHADWIVVLDDGRIAAQGDHETLLRRSDIYREVYESQQKGGDGNEQ